MLQFFIKHQNYKNSTNNVKEYAQLLHVLKNPEITQKKKFAGYSKHRRRIVHKDIFIKPKTPHISQRVTSQNPPMLLYQS